MEMIRARNQQTAMPTLLNEMYSNGELDGEMLAIRHPVAFTFERPRERMIFWPGFRRNPAHELRSALQSLSQSEAAIEPAAKSVLDGAQHFLFSTPQLAVQASVAGDGRMDMFAVLADTNPFTGAFGQVNLQLSVLLELMAASVKRRVGELTIQHQGLALQKGVVEQLLRASLDNLPEDPYSRGMKPRKIDGPLQMKMVIEEGAKAMGYKSKWVRQVALPLLSLLEVESAADALELCKNIKADDMRRAALDWCDAVQQAEAFKAMQEERAGGEA